MLARHAFFNPFQTSVSFPYPMKKSKPIGIEMAIEIKGLGLLNTGVEWIIWVPLNTQQTITCSKSTIETLKEGVKYVQN